MDLTTGVFSFRTKQRNRFKALDAAAKREDVDFPDNVCPFVDLAGHGFRVLQELSPLVVFLTKLDSWTDGVHTLVVKLEEQVNSSPCSKLDSFVMGLHNKSVKTVLQAAKVVANRGLDTAAIVEAIASVQTKLNSVVDQEVLSITSELPSIKEAIDELRGCHREQVLTRIGSHVKDAEDGRQKSLFKSDGAKNPHPSDSFFRAFRSEVDDVAKASQLWPQTHLRHTS